MQETILIVDDEASVRQTVREWLDHADLGCLILDAADAEAALTLANQHAIDLAILDWNLGSGDDGLQLLQDLAAFHPDIVAIMITGFANLATPLDAMRMGVRDYLDKNHDFGRESLVKSVGKQLAQIRPAKQVRRLHHTLVTFRNAVEQIVPLVQSAAALQDAVPLPEAVRGLVRFLVQATGAADGLLLVRHYDARRDPPEAVHVYDARGEALPPDDVPFARSLAGSAASLGQPCAMNDLAAAPTGAMDLHGFERSRQNLLAVPLAVAPGIRVVIELFDKPEGFDAQDQRLAAAAADLGTDMMRQALGQKQTHELLLEAVAVALKASDGMAASMSSAAAPPPPDEVMACLRAGLQHAPPAGALNESSLRLAEAIRALAARHGEPALDHCLSLVRQVHDLLDRTAG